MFRKYLSSLPRTIVTEAVASLYGVLIEASEGEAGNYFRKTIRAAAPGIIQDLHDDTVEVMETEKPDEPEENWLSWLWNWFRQDFGLRNSEAVYFAPGLARIVLCQPDSEETFYYCPLESLSRNAETMKDIVHYITIAHKDEYTRYLVEKASGKPATFDSLVDKFGAAIKKQGEELMANLDEMEYTPSDYVIVELKDFNTASKFADYTDLGDYTDSDTKKWCYLEHEGTFDYYRNNGTIRCYLAYKPGFEDLEPGEEGYGQSMLGIDIGPGNKIVHCNNRYNHEDDPELDNDENPPGDNRFDATELSRLLGGPYYKFCPYYSKEERLSLGIIAPEDIDEMVANGEPIDRYVQFGREMDNGDCQISVCNMYNILKADGTLLFKRWMTKIKPINFRRVPAYLIVVSDKCMICDINGNPMLDEWYAEIDVRTDEGTIDLQRQDGTKNSMRIDDGKIIFRNWYMSKISNLSDNLYVARKADQKVHFMNKEEEDITDLTVDWITSLVGQYYIIRSDGTYNIISGTDPTPIMDPWFNNYEMAAPNHAKVLRVERNIGDDQKVFNFVDAANPSSGYLLEQWAKNVQYDYKISCWKVEYTGANGERLFNMFNPAIHKEILPAPLPGFHVSLDGITISQGRKSMLIGLNGKPLVSDWVDSFDDDNHSEGRWLRNENKHNYADKSGKTLLDEWYDNVQHGINQGDFIVTKDKKKNVIRNNTALFDQWADEIKIIRDYYKYDCYYQLKYGDLSTVADADGNILLNDMYKYIDTIMRRHVILVSNPEGATLCIDGKRALDGWYDTYSSSSPNYIRLFSSYAYVKKEGKVNILLYTNQWLFDQWFDDCVHIDSKNPAFVVKRDGKYNVWNTDHVEFDHWYDNCDKNSYDYFGYWLYDNKDNPNRQRAVKACHCYTRNDDNLFFEYSKDSE